MAGTTFVANLGTVMDLCDDLCHRGAVILKKLIKRLHETSLKAYSPFACQVFVQTFVGAKGLLSCSQVLAAFIEIFWTIFILWRHLSKRKHLNKM